MAQSADFSTDQTLVEKYNKVPLPYFELIRLDGRKSFESKTWLERFQQKTKKTIRNRHRTDEYGKKTKQKQKRLRKRKPKDFPMGVGTHKTTRNKVGNKVPT